MSATAGESGTSPTPILHREAPLPPQVKAGSGQMLVVTVWASITVAIGASVMLGYPLIPEWLLEAIKRGVVADWTGTQVVLLGASIFGAYFAMIALHEGGHALGGHLVGFRFQSLRGGPLVIDS